jgi:hypothetical protein
MAFKQNLPIPLLVAGVLVAALAGLVLFHEPPEEDQIRQAVDKYVATLGPVKQLEIHGHVADIIYGEKNTLVYAEFEKKDGAWTCARNLAEEFTCTMKDPATEQSVLTHLAERVSQRLQTAVTIKEGLSVSYRLARDAEGILVGQCDIGFGYPKVGEQQRSGKYSEFFEWKDGR